MERKATAVWRGNLRDGKGEITTNSKALSATPYSFSTRFENDAGTNPEELIAAAHAGCFSMALSSRLNEVGLTPDSIHTTATITIEKLDIGWTVTESHLDVIAKIPGADKSTFDSAAHKAKTNCPISRLLNTRVTMNAKLES